MEDRVGEERRKRQRRREREGREEWTHYADGP